MLSFFLVVNSNFRILYYVDMVHLIWYMFKDKGFCPCFIDSKFVLSELSAETIH